MRATADLHPFDSLELRQRRRAEHRRAAPERWSVRAREQAAEPRLPVWQSCLLAGGGSLLLWGAVGAAAWRLLG